MDFNLTNNDRPPSLHLSFPPSLNSDGYLSSQASRGGLLGTGWRELLELELRRERIREEMVHRRLLEEEEARRDLAIERNLVFGRGGIDGLLPPVGISGRLNPAVQLYPSLSDARSGQSGKRSELSRDADLRVERLRALAAYDGLRMVDNLRSTHTPSEVVAGTSPIFSIVGTKRKIETATRTESLPRSSPKKWNCSLCKVTTTSKSDLDEHLKGKKHMAKAVKVNINNVSQNDATTKSSLKKKPKLECAVKPKSEDSMEPKFECKICKVSCNSSTTLNSHLEGKKHKAQLGNPNPKVLYNAEKTGSTSTGGGAKGTGLGVKEAQEAPSNAEKASSASTGDMECVTRDADEVALEIEKDDKTNIGN